MMGRTRKMADMAGDEEEGVLEQDGRCGGSSERGCSGACFVQAGRLWDRECSSDALVFAAELASPAFSARLQYPGTLEVFGLSKWEGSCMWAMVNKFGGEGGEDGQRNGEGR